MDLKLNFNNCDEIGCVDLSLGCGDLSRGDDLTTAVMISLFTDRRANADDAIEDGTQNPRGWWADALDGQKIGSRLWLLQHARSLPETLRLAQDYAKESLQWLIEDGIASGIEVTATFIDECKNTLGLSVQLKKPEGRLLAWRYRYAWDLKQMQSCENLGPSQ